MTVSSENARSGPYLGNGATAFFAYDFRVLSDEHLRVTVVDAAGIETILVLASDYSVTGVGNAQGGSVVLTAPLATGLRLVITRDVPATQEVDLQNQGPFFAETIERAFDKLTMVAQQGKEEDSRSVSLSVTSDGVSALLPDAVANAILGWNASADALENKTPNTAAYVVAPLANLTSNEATQLLNIGPTTISAAQWGYLGAMGAQPLEEVLLTEASGLVPVGTVISFSGLGFPDTGWLVANGQNVLRAQWPELFARYGVFWGAGDGSTTFGVPDLRGRVVAGRDAVEGGAAANRLNIVIPNSTSLGATGGDQRVTLIAAQMPSHRHRIANVETTNADLLTSNFMGVRRTTPDPSVYGLGGSNTEPALGLTTQAGSGEPHPNVQPTMILNKLIFAGREVPQS